MVNRGLEINLSDVDMHEIEALLSRFSNSQKLMARAINRTMLSVQTKTVKKIGEELAIKPPNSSPAKRIKRDFKMVKATARRDTEASLSATGKPLPLSNFSPVQVLSGVRVKIKKSGGRKVIKGGFLAKPAGSGTKNVFMRRYRRDHLPKPVRPNRKYPHRLPVLFLSGPRIEDIYARHFPEITADAGDIFMTKLRAVVEDEILRNNS